MSSKENIVFPNCMIIMQVKCFIMLKCKGLPMECIFWKVYKYFFFTIRVIKI